MENPIQHSNPLYNLEPVRNNYVYFVKDTLNCNEDKAQKVVNKLYQLNYDVASIYDTIQRFQELLTQTAFKKSDIIEIVEVGDDAEVTDENSYTVELDNDSTNSLSQAESDKAPKTNDVIHNLSGENGNNTVLQTTAHDFFLRANGILQSKKVDVTSSVLQAELITQVLTKLKVPIKLLPFIMEEYAAISHSLHEIKKANRFSEDKVNLTSVLFVSLQNHGIATDIGPEEMLSSTGIYQQDNKEKEQAIKDYKKYAKDFLRKKSKNTFSEIYNELVDLESKFKSEPKSEPKSKPKSEFKSESKPELDFITTNIANLTNFAADYIVNHIVNLSINKGKVINEKGKEALKNEIATLSKRFTHRSELQKTEPESHIPIIVLADLITKMESKPSQEFDLTETDNLITALIVATQISFDVPIHEHLHDFLRSIDLYIGYQESEQQMYPSEYREEKSRIKYFFEKQKGFLNYIDYGKNSIIFQNETSEITNEHSLLNLYKKSLEKNNAIRTFETSPQSSPKSNNLSIPSNYISSPPSKYSSNNSSYLPSPTPSQAPDNSSYTPPLVSRNPFSDPNDIYENPVFFNEQPINPPQNIINIHSTHSERKSANQATEKTSKQRQNKNRHSKNRKQTNPSSHVRPTTSHHNPNETIKLAQRGAIFFNGLSDAAQAVAQRAANPLAANTVARISRNTAIKLDKSSSSKPSIRR